MENKTLRSEDEHMETYAHNLFAALPVDMKQVQVYLKIVLTRIYNLMVDKTYPGGDM
jgi:hypothetical protein